LTGGIASGKSTVARSLVERGAILVDADELAREVVEPGTPAWSKIVEHFGPGVLLGDRRIDRPKVAEIVFNDRAKLALLNEITHPEVMRRIADRLEELQETDHVVIVDVPLLAEVGARDMFDMIVVVTAKEDAQLERMRAMRGMDAEAARARIASQAAAEDRAAIADWVIENDGSLEHLEHEIDRLWAFLEANRGGRKAH
jgi:dephospho-CoA kinase